MSVAEELPAARTLDEDHARALAARLHRGQRDGAGAPLIDHVARVAAAVTTDARVAAWLHEVFEYTPTSEEDLLAEGVSTEELRALRLLTRDRASRSSTRYLGHVRLIADAVGPGADIARAGQARGPRRPRGPPDGRRRRLVAAVRPRPRDPPALLARHRDAEQLVGIEPVVGVGRGVVRRRSRPSAPRR